MRGDAPPAFGSKVAPGLWWCGVRDRAGVVHRGGGSCMRFDGGRGGRVGDHQQTIGSSNIAKKAEKL